MKIKKVAVLGAGAVGSYIIWGLSKVKCIELGVVADGNRARRLKKGCRINNSVYYPEVWTPQVLRSRSFDCCTEIRRTARSVERH